MVHLGRAMLNNKQPFTNVKWKVNGYSVILAWLERAFFRSCRAARKNVTPTA